MVDFCAVGNIYFDTKSLHKYTSMPRGKDRVEVKSMIDLVLVKKDITQYVQDEAPQIIMLYCV